MRIAISSKHLILVAILLGTLLSLNLLGVPAARAQTPLPPVTPAPTPGGGAVPTPAPGPSPTPAPNPIQQIFHTLLFPAETISEALANIFASAAEQEAESLSAQAGDWALLLGQVVQAPAAGYYETIAQSSLPVAAALAPALFLLRLALYHWRRLVGDDDSALAVIGDWVAAGTLAVAAGPFLDLLTEVGWWIAGATLGETAELAQSFIEATTVFSAASALAKVSLFSGILLIGVVVGGILAMAGMLFAFASAQAALYVMAVLAAPLAVAGVLRHMRWLRSLWIKAVALLVLLPIAAGGIFKAGVALSTFFSGDGLLSILIRLLWLWGATGFLLALAGILGRVTLSASVEAFGKFTGAVKAIVGTAGLASMAGAGGAVGGAGGGLAGGSAGGGGVGLGPAGPVRGDSGPRISGASPSVGPASGGSQQGSLEHIEQAQAWTRKAGTLGAIGLHGPAGYARTQARLAELAGRRLSLERRLAHFSSSSPLSSDAPADQVTATHREAAGGGKETFSPSVDARIRSVFSGSEESFQAGFRDLSPYIKRSGLDPATVAQMYPEETARMVQAYLDHPQKIAKATDPLQEAARRGGAAQFLKDIYQGDRQVGIEPLEPPEYLTGVDSSESEAPNLPAGERPETFQDQEIDNDKE